MFNQLISKRRNTIQRLAKLSWDYKYYKMIILSHFELKITSIYLLIYQQMISKYPFHITNFNLIYLIVFFMLFLIK